MNETKRLERRYLPDFVYGGMDGVISTFAVVSGVIGAGLSPIVILVLGFANVFADGFSMAVSNYFSIKSKNELVKAQDKHPMKGAAVTFLSFFLMGCIPLLSFIFSINNPALLSKQLQFSIILTAAALFTIGWFEGEVTNKHPLKSSVQALVVGVIASLLAFAVGKLISNIV